MFDESTMFADLAKADAVGDTALAKKIALQIKAARQAEAAKKEYDPTAGMSTAQKVLAGVGESFDRVGNLFRTKEQVKEREALNAPLLKTGAGKAGQVIGDLTKGLAIAVPTAGAGLLPSLGANVVGGAALGAAESRPDERLGNAVVGGAMGAIGEGVGRAAGHLIAPLRGLATSGTRGERGMLKADTDIIKRKLGAGVAEKLPLSAAMAEPTQSGGVRRLEIALRNLPVVGKRMKLEDKALRDAYARQLFSETGTDIGEDAIGPAAFRLMDTGLAQRADELGARLAASGDVPVQGDLAERLLGIQRGLTDMRLPSERAAADAAAARATSASADVMPAVDAARFAREGADYAAEKAAAEGVAPLKTAEEAAREAVVAARLAAGEGWRSDAAYKSALKEWNELRRAGREVRPTELGEAAALKDASRAETAAQAAVTKMQTAVQRAEKAAQESGWAEFDNLIADASRVERLSAADLMSLRRRANNLFESTRVSEEVANKTEKLGAIRDFKSALDDAADAVIGAPGTFRKLAQQEGMASTLRAARNTAGEMDFSPGAVSRSLELAFGPKAAAAEASDAFKLAGALERRAMDSFASGPEQYKALMAGTLMGEGAFSALGSLKGMITSPLAMMLLATKRGRDYLKASDKRGAAGKLAERLIAGAATGQADLLGL